MDEIKTGDLVFIEAPTGTLKDNGNWSIKGNYTVASVSELKIHLNIDDGQTLGIYKSRIQRIEIIKPVHNINNPC